MQVSPIDSLTRFTSTRLITFYQRQISPHKGFSCAYRILHRGESCSQYVKRVIQTEGLLPALPLIRERFRACKQASQVLRTRNHLWQARALGAEEPEGEEKRKGQNPGVVPPTSEGAGTTSSGNNPCSDCNSGIDCVSLSCNAIDCSDLACSGTDCNSLDCNGLDCHSLDCHGLDCGSCDFGSCGG